jgi:ribosome maturation protein SDO1
MIRSYNILILTNIQSEKDINEVLQIPQVFLNVSKGQVAPNDDLLKAFGITDTDKIVQEILQKGEIQLSEKERQAKTEQIQAEVLQIISTKCINPKTKKRYPPTMIQKVLSELKVNIVSTKPSKTQALEAIRLLVSKQIIPIVRAKMKVKVVFESKDAKKVSDKVKPLLGAIESEDSGRVWEVISLIDPVNYRELVELVGKHKTATLEVLDMAVIDEADN